MQLTKLHHIAINVSDYDRSKEFYIEKLGFRVLGEYVFNSGTRRMDCAAGEVRLEIFCHAETTGAFAEKSIGYRHLCLHTDDLEADVAQLKVMGIPVEDIRTDVMAGGNMAFFCDPDGITIELHE